MNDDRSQVKTNVLGALLLVSVALNIGLGIYVLQRVQRTDLKAAGLETEGDAAEKLPEAKPAIDVAKLTTNSPRARFGWESVESADYKEYIANLRAVGCPEETIRDIIRADVKKLYYEKKREVRKAAPRFAYWLGDDFIRGEGKEAWLKLLSLNDEEGKVLKALGIEPEISLKDAKNSAAMDWMLDFLDQRKKAEVYRIRKETDDKLALRDGTVNIEAVLQEMDRKLKAILTPEEALQYDLRFSIHARGSHGLFEPTEEEYIALYQARKAVAEEAGIGFSGVAAANAGTPAERRARREETERQLQEALRTALGPDRYAEYQMKQDYRYRAIHEATKEAELGNAEAKQVYEMKKIADAQLAPVQADQNLSEEQRAAALEGIRNETARTIRGVLGEKGWERFRKSNPGLEVKTQ